MSKSKKQDKKESFELKYEEMEIQGICIGDIQKIDKKSEDCYNVKLKDGSEQELSFDEGELQLVDHFLNRYQENDDALVTEGPETSGDLPELPRVDRKTLEKTIANEIVIDFFDPDMRGYWSSDQLLAKRLSMGYIYCQPNMIRSFKETFRGFNVGEGFSTGGGIKVNGLTLLVAHKDTVQAINDLNYSKRHALNQPTKQTVQFQA